MAERLLEQLCVKRKKYFLLLINSVILSGKDLTWYTKQSKVDLKAAQEAERREIKLKEQDLMLQML
jgi:hypothetical protein